MSIGTTIRKEIKDLFSTTPNKKPTITRTYNYTYKELKEALRIKEEITDIRVNNETIIISTKEE